MSERILEDYLAEVRRNLGHLAPAERDAVIGEMRSHLLEKIAGLRGELHLSEEEAALRATQAFGTPAEITVQFGPQGGVVKSPTGEPLLRLAAIGGRALRATGRGLGRTLKWIGIIFAITVSAALISATIVAVVFDDEIRGLIPHRIYERGEYYEQQNGTHTEFFDVSPRYESFEIQISSWAFDREDDNRTSCATIQLISPSGDRIDLNTATNDAGDCYNLRRELTFSQSGRWQVAYDFEAFTGWIEINVQGYQ